MNFNLFSRRSFLRALPAACVYAGGAAHSQQARTESLTQQPFQRLIAESENIRSQSIPRPDAGVVDLQWRELSPPGWKPRLKLDKSLTRDWKDDDPRLLKLMRELERDWQKAPAVTTLPTGLIRIDGYPAMPEGAAKTTNRIMLAPYYGSCLHSPTPPANQLVFVNLTTEIPAEMYQFPIWVIGQIVAKPKGLGRVRAAYSMENARWEPYLYLKYPQRPYRLPF